MNADNTIAHVLEFEIEGTTDEVDGRCHFMLNRKQYFLFIQAIQQDTTQSVDRSVSVWFALKSAISTYLCSGQVSTAYDWSCHKLPSEKRMLMIRRTHHECRISLRRKTCSKKFYRAAEYKYAEVHLFCE